MSRILITSALPYANGPIHIGHLLEYIQTDIWYRFHKQRGREVYYICADDAHGTAIMLKSQLLNTTAEDLISSTSLEHQRDFAGFNIQFDYYGSTHSDQNKALSLSIYNTLVSKGYVFTKTIQQLFDTEKELFLSDRFVKGDCPKCQAPDQYGDHCEKCGTTYNAEELKNSYSVLSGQALTLKESEHIFFDLPQFSDMLSQWIHSGVVAPEMAHKLDEWIKAPLKPWDISRDAPYFGFEIPDTKNKYFYVWLDAPICYISAFNEYAKKSGLSSEEFWQPDSLDELYHFIGKDIINFHGLFWPAMLEGAGYRKPSGIFTHGFITVNGQKMSKSRGTLISAENYLSYLPAEALRFYYGSKMSAKTEDINLNFEDFKTKINSDVVGKFVNIASRCFGFIHKFGQGEISEIPPDSSLWKNVEHTEIAVIKYFENREFSAAIKCIMLLLDDTNSYINDQAPWQLAKLESGQKKAHDVCSEALQVFYAATIMLHSIMPKLCQKSAVILNTTLDWSQPITPMPKGHKILEFTPLFSRIEQQAIDNLLSASSANENSDPTPD